MLAVHFNFSIAVKVVFIYFPASLCMLLTVLPASLCMLLTVLSASLCLLTTIFTSITMHADYSFTSITMHDADYSFTRIIMHAVLYHLICLWTDNSYIKRHCFFNLVVYTFLITVMSTQYYSILLCVASIRMLLSWY